MKEEIIIQQQLLEPFGGAQQQLGSRRSAAQEGHLPNGQDLANLLQDNSPMKKVLNESVAPRVIIASNPNESLSLLPEQIAITGGWCALRTADVAKIAEGVVMNPVTGSVEKVTSVQQVADWIENSIAFDQIIESIGALTGSEYVAVSEQRLWTDRIIAKTAKILTKEALSLSEEELICKSVENAEKKRAIMTERYLRLVTGNKRLKLVRAVDEDFWDELINARDELLQRAGISIEGLQNEFPNQAETIPSQTLVWAMYSEPYFDALRRTGYISAPKVLIAEPTLHTYADDQAGAFVVKRIYQNKGIYFDQQGINPNTGFVAFMECIQANGTSTRKKLTVDQVPNIANWQNLFDGEMFDPTLSLDIAPERNKLFLWAVNLIPFGKTKDTLLALLAVKQKYREVVKATKIKSRDEAEAIKAPFLAKVDILNQALAIDLWEFFKMMTQEL